MNWRLQIADCRFGTLGRLLTRAALSVLMLAVATASATDYYVRTDGNDANAGTADTAGGAKLTPSGAASVTISAGDRVFVRAGTYSGFTESTSGSSGNLIQWIADGTNSVTVTSQITVSGSYVRISNFQVTHTSDGGASARGIHVTGAHCEILDNLVHRVSADCVSMAGAHWLTIRGNTMELPGYPNGVEAREAGNIMENGSISTNLLIEYNISRRCADHINTEVGGVVMRNGFFGPVDATGLYSNVASPGGGAGVPHVDVVQANVVTTNLFAEANYVVDNTSTEAHGGGITSFSGAQYWLFRKSVIVNNGDGSGLWLLGPGSHIYGWQNTIINQSLTDSGGNPVVWARGGGNAGTDFLWRGNCLTNAPDATGANTFLDETGTSQLQAGYNLGYPLFPGSTGTDLVQDPQLENMTTGDYRPRSGSPLIDRGLFFTTVNGSGTSATFTVNSNAWAICAGFSGMVLPDKIRVGSNNNLTVVSVSGNSVTVDQSIPFSSDDQVGPAYRGSAADWGAYEFGDTPLTGAIVNTATGTVSTSGDARFVEQRRLGVRIAVDETAPYNFSHQSGDTYRAYALHAQATMVFTATEESSSAPAPGLRGSFRIGGNGRIRN